MNEEFVPFELAKKLTLKGFNAPCIAYYDEGFFRYNTKYPFALTAEELLISHNSEYTWVDAPTISQVLKWLREEKKLHIGISPQWQYTVYDMRCSPWIGYSDMQNYDDYTKAALAGIEYCLDNLI